MGQAVCRPWVIFCMTHAGSGWLRAAWYRVGLGHGISADSFVFALCVATAGMSAMGWACGCCSASHWSRTGSCSWPGIEEVGSRASGVRV
jgi:hypothetical protein